jgi:hypothetical protein
VPGGRARGCRSSGALACGGPSSGRCGSWRGVLTAAGAGLALTTGPLWALVPLVTGSGLTFAGLTNLCGMATVLGWMPWNRPKPLSRAAPTRPATTCCG